MTLQWLNLYLAPAQGSSFNKALEHSAVSLACSYTIKCLQAHVILTSLEIKNEF